MGQTYIGMPRGAKMSLALDVPKKVGLLSKSSTTSEHAPQVKKKLLKENQCPTKSLVKLKDNSTASDLSKVHAKYLLQENIHGEELNLTFYNLVQTELYKEDWIGLRGLDEGGRVSYISFPGDHLNFNEDQIKEYVVPYLRPSPSMSGWSS